MNGEEGVVDVWELPVSECTANQMIDEAQHSIAVRACTLEVPSRLRKRGTNVVPLEAAGTNQTQNQSYWRTVKKYHRLPPSPWKI